MLLSVPTFVHRLLQRLLKTLTDKLDKDYQLAKTDLRRLVGAAASAGFCPPCPFCLLPQICSGRPGSQAVPATARSVLGCWRSLMSTSNLLHQKERR